MTYVQLWDVIQDQLWSYQDQNILKSNLDYMLQTCLGITEDSDSGHAAYIKFQSAEGLEFNGGSTEYLKPDAGNNYLAVESMDLKMAIPHWIRGERGIIYFSNFSIADTDDIFHLSGSKTLTLGYRMARPGSIVTISYVIDVVSAVGAGTVNYRAHLYKNGSSFLQGTQTSDVASTTTYRVTDTYARDAQTFVAGDLIELQHDATVGGAGVTISAVASCELEIVLDE